MYQLTTYSSTCIVLAIKPLSRMLSQRSDLDRRPSLYKSVALPLSYAGKLRLALQLFPIPLSEFLAFFLGFFPQTHQQIIRFLFQTQSQDTNLGKEGLQEYFRGRKPFEHF